jgi:tRNA pseudouridine38-40 synthase
MEQGPTKLYAITVAYDGTNYYGWQEQQAEPTITGVLQEIFEVVFSHPIRITGSSRTDAGVHALGQVATFWSHLEIEPQLMMRAWNHRLPTSIQIRTLAIAGDGFHPQHNVQRKTYYYYFCSKRPLPMMAQYVWFYRYRIDHKKLADALQLFVGTHDFKNFCTMAEGDLRSTRRTIESIELRYLHRYRVWRITVRGQSFLHYMIRRIVGAALHVSRNDTFPLTAITDALANKPGHLAGILPKAPAHGLLLRKIQYKDE